MKESGKNDEKVEKKKHRNFDLLGAEVGGTFFFSNEGAEVTIGFTAFCFVFFGRFVKGAEKSTLFTSQKHLGANDKNLVHSLLTKPFFFASKTALLGILDFFFDCPFPEFFAVSPSALLSKPESCFFC